MPAPILPWQEGVRKAAAVLSRGGVVAFPTETYYGLAADPRDEAACRRIFAIKRRPEGLALPLLGGHERELSLVTARPHPLVEALVRHGWPSAFSAIVPPGPGLAPLFPDGVAFRVSPHPVAAHLTRLFGHPVTSTSANLHGDPPVRTAAACAHLEVDLVLDGGETPGGLPSTLARPTDDGWEVLRAGPVIPDRWPAAVAPPGWTRDKLPACAAWVLQPPSGNRFTLDAILLAHFSRRWAPRRVERVLDLGAGTGVLCFWLREHLPGALCTGLERDPDAVEGARLAAGEQGLRADLEFFAGDLADEARMIPGGAFDLVVSNPPFFVEDSRPSPDPARRAGRHDEEGFLARTLDCAQRVLRPGGKAALVLPATRLQEALSTASLARLHLTDLRMVHPRAGEPANRTLVAFVKTRRTTPVFHPPLFVHDTAGYSPELGELLQSGRGSAGPMQEW